MFVLLVLSKHAETQKMDETKDDSAKPAKKEWQTPEITQLDLALTANGDNESPLEAFSGVGEFES